MPNSFWEIVPTGAQGAFIGSDEALAQPVATHFIGGHLLVVRRQLALGGFFAAQDCAELAAFNNLRLASRRSTSVTAFSICVSQQFLFDDGDGHASHDTGAIRN